MLKRKLVSASITSIILALILALLTKALDIFMFSNLLIKESFLSEIVGLVHLYLLYGFPILIVYGVITSIVSEKVASFIAKKANNKRLLFWVSGSLHLFFGLIMLLYGVLGASIFFLIDTILYKKFTNLKWYIVILFVLLPVILFFACFTSIS